MVMSEAMLRMIAPAQPREPNTAPHSIPSSSPSIRAQVTLASENDDPNPMSSAKRKRASQVVDIDTMVDASFMCCTKLRCVESFVLGTGDIAALRAEQKVLAAITGNQARSDFVNNLIPLVKPDKFSGAMLAGQRLVCTKFFRKAFNVSNNMIQALKNNDGSPASKGKKRARMGTDPELRNACLGHLDYYASIFGQHMPHKNATYLYIGSKKELYLEFATDRRKQGLPDISYSYYLRIWKQHRPSIKARTGGDFMKCHLCTLHKDSLYGAPGIRASTDPETRKAAQDAYDKHLKNVELDRACLALNDERAMKAKCDREPLRFVSIQADAAAQTAFALPMLSPLTHGTDRGYAERQKIMAVLVEGQFVEVFLTPQTLGGGCNLICTAIHLALSRLFKEHVAEGTQPYIEHLSCQVDNCVSENKNHTLIGYLGSLVGRGIIGSVEIQFMLVGHTHIRIDQIFSRFAVGCKHLNIFTRDDQAKAFADAYKTMPVHTTTLRNLGNFKGVLQKSGCVRKIPGITKPRAFQLLRRGPHQVSVGMKPFMHSEAYTGMTSEGVFTGMPHPLFVSGIPAVDDAPEFTLKKVDDATICKVQQRYDAAHERVDRLFSQDSARRDAIKAEMNRSVNLLRAEGTCAWDLPTSWLAPADSLDDDDDSNDDESDGDLSSGIPPGGSSDIDSFDRGKGDGARDGTTSSDGLRSLAAGGRQDELSPVRAGPVLFRKGDSTNYPPEISGERGDGDGDELDLASMVGNFAFFLADSAPVLVGKVLDFREQDGEEEVQVHWYTPVNRSLRDNASTVAFDEYCNTRVAYAADYVFEEVSGVRAKRVPDVDWDSVERVVVWSKKKVLNGSGKKLPKRVVDAVSEAYIARQNDL